uniref:Protein mesh (inferred by orthology to a D. melanogaster protein) n=1 Tax=Strongyloides venezuelensis TaxID=75913 RepID=A0A0K0F7J0_STRVS
MHTPVSRFLYILFFCYFEYGYSFRDYNLKNNIDKIPTLYDEKFTAPNFSKNNDDIKKSHQGQNINSLTNSQIIFLNTVTNVQTPGIHGSKNMYNMPGNQTPRITAQNLREIDWSQVDRRSEEGWWHLYPFGERFFDRELAHRPWMDKQIDLDFFFPYYGFRFNYTFIFHEGFIAFSHPWYIQPPYTYPTPQWPKKPDPTLIAAFMADQQMQHVGDTRISNVWFRIVERPYQLIGYNSLETDFTDDTTRIRNDPMERQPLGVYSYDDSRFYRTYRGRQLKTENGRLEDPEFLDKITNDIREGMVGARGWKADYALIITWERMSYGGAPKITNLDDYERAKRWQNTYQMVIATDEIRSYVMLNYAHINWTSSAQAGALTGGRGGKQSALVGFNGGNGTGWYELPYSAEGNSYKLVQYGSTQIAGRWLARVDEQIQYGGCSNDSRGLLELSQQYGNMLGGISLNVSGPCYRPFDIIKLQFDEITLDCERIDMVIARCVIPVNSVFKIGLVEVKLSVDGGKNYPWWTKFYILQPGLARRRVNLINDPRDVNNNWNNFNAQNLSLSWEWQNITTNPNAIVDISLYGYWEDVEGHSFKKIGHLARNYPNTGQYTFNPRSLIFDDEADPEAWRWYFGGIVQVSLSDPWLEDRGDGIYWSSPVSFGWFFQQKWEFEKGKHWALEICQEWFDYDGRRENFAMELEPKIPCPCTLNQALVDIGRFTSLPDCDMESDHKCYYTQGAQHCVLSTFSVWTGAGQVCCYDYEGWLMFSDDFEYNDQYLRFYSPGVPYRAHPWGSYPYKRPPYVPTMSNLYNDLLPYDFCCKWAGHCEFYFWRRQTSSCQMYETPSIGFIYGGSHIVTFDGGRYSFHGKGYYVLTMHKSKNHDLMIQGRLEQPPKTIWEDEVRSTVLTGISAKDNGSSIVEVFARKDFRRWRYKTDVYVDGVRVYFDMPWKKIQTFQGVTIRNPPRNMNQSDIDIMFTTGVGIRVQESRGLLNIIVTLPPNYKEESIYDPFSIEENLSTIINMNLTMRGTLSEYDRCMNTYRTQGLLGTYNGRVEDEFTTPNCKIIRAPYPQSEGDARNLYYNFGEKWRLDRNLDLPMLFNPDRKPIYDPLSFANPNFEPIFNPWLYTNSSFYEQFIFTRDEVKVVCQGDPSCEYDYIMTGRREVGLTTLDYQKQYSQFKRKGEVKHQSCGPLMKNPGVIKYPPGNNYLDGVTVTFTCTPEYFLHGDQIRECKNGTWSKGWWAWCRLRSEEIALKWMTGILSSVAILIALTLIFCLCHKVGRARQIALIKAHYGHKEDRDRIIGSPQFFNFNGLEGILSPNILENRSKIDSDYNLKITGFNTSV